MDCLHECVNRVLKVLTDFLLCLLQKILERSQSFFFGFEELFSKEIQELLVLFLEMGDFLNKIVLVEKDLLTPVVFVLVRALVLLRMKDSSLPSIQVCRPFSLLTLSFSRR